MGASSDRKITLDYDRQLQVDGFSNFIRLRFENSHAGSTHSHKWVDVHSTITEGVATNLDVPVTAADRAALLHLCATAKALQGDPAACFEKFGHIATAAWGADVSNACGDLIGDGVLQEGPGVTAEEAEADQLAVMTSWISYMIRLGAFLGGE